jgi:hypothetical protein
MAAVIKNLASSGVLFTDRRYFDLDSAQIAQLYPSENPFIAWMQKLNTRKVKDPDFKMFQDTGAWRNQSFLAAAGGSFSSSGDPGGTVTIACDTAVNVGINQSLLGAQVEIWDTTETTYRGVAIVTTVSGSNVTLKVLGNPNAANQRIAAVVDNDVFKVFSRASGEGSTSPEVNHDELTNAWNSTQITRVPLQITGTLLEAALYAGPKGTNELSRLRDVKAKEFKLAKERKLLMGYRIGGISIGASGTFGSGDSFSASHTTDADGNIIRTTMGFLPIMQRYGITSDSASDQNVFTFTKATMKFADILAAVEKMSQYGGSMVRDVFCGPSAITYWTSLANAQNSGFEVKVSEMRSDDTYGFNYKFLELGAMTFRLIPMPLFHTHPVYKNWMLIPNEDAIEHAVYRSDRYNVNIKSDNGFDGQKDEYFADDGLYLSQVATHALIKLQ